MIIFLSSKASISDASYEQIKWLKSKLTVENPVFNQKYSLGLSIWNTPRHLTYYEFVSDSTIEVPIGIIPEFISIFDVDRTSIIDGRVTNSKKEFFDNLTFTGQLRDYQEDMVSACMDKDFGVVECKTGGGKTAAFVNLTLRRKEPTLILVNTIELAQQATEAFLNFTNIKKENIGFIGDSKFEAKTITIGLHQSFARMQKERFNILNEKIGMVIADEVHVCAANTYFKTMINLSAKYKYGFSATPKRADGLTDVIFFCTGPKIHTVPAEKLTNVLIKPTIKSVNTNFKFQLFSSSEYQYMINMIAIDENRNNLIIDTYNKEYVGKPTCMLCNRVEQIHILKEKIGDSAVILISEMNKKVRKKNLEDFISGEKSVIISTYQLFSTGIDIPKLEVLFLCSPIQSETQLKQAVGRLMRKAVGKTEAVVIDFVDNLTELLRIHAIKRQKIYKGL